MQTRILYIIYYFYNIIITDTIYTRNKLMFLNWGKKGLKHVITDNISMMDNLMI